MSSDLFSFPSNPFSLYDFMGYFIPGAIFVLSLSTIISKQKELENILSTFHISYIKTETTLFYIVLILICYLFGQMLSLLSAMSIERYSLDKYGYPTHYLLGLKKAKNITERICPFTNCILTVFLFPLAPINCSNGLIYAFYIKEEEIKDVLIEAIVSILQEAKFIKGLFETNEEFLNDLARNNKNFFRYIYHYVLENSTEHKAKINNYLGLFGFFRSLTLVFTIMFWVSVILLIFNHDNYYFLCFIIAYLLLSYISFIGYIKFHKRYTLEVLMAACIIYQKKIK